MPEPLVLLPAMMSDARLFADVLPALSRGRAVGIGHYGTAARMEDMAAQVLDDAPARFALLGIGMGGMVAMEVLRRAPERVRRLVLIGTTPLAESPQHAAAREPLVIAARTGRIGEVMDQMRPAGSFAPGPARMQAQRLMREMAQDLGGDAFARQTRALQRRRDQQSTLRRMRQPATVLCGEYDSIYPPKRHRFMADLIPGARVEVIADAGHLPVLDQPEACVQAIEAALSGTAATGAAR